MPVRCQDCNHHFLVDAQHVVNGLSCDNCGSQRLERDQPSPTKSDGELRDMVDPITQEDQGGNPLGEGTIMGSDGERPHNKRDNYMHAKTAVYPHVPAYMTTPDEQMLDSRNWPQAQPMQCPHCGAITTPQLGMCPHCRQEINPEMIYHTGKVAFDFGDFDFSEQGPQSIHKFIVGHDGQVHSLPSPTTHEEIANQYGLQHFPNRMSLGELMDNGTTHWYQHEAPHDVNSLVNLVSNHFGMPVMINPELKPTTSDERWFGEGYQPSAPGEQMLPNFPQRKLDEAQAVQNRGRAFPYYDNPFFNRGGSMHRATFNTEPYLPWAHEAANPAEGSLSAQVVPGPHGIHAGTVKWLSFFNANVNGLNSRQHGMEIFKRFGNRASPEFGQPVTVEVHHPSHLPAAIETIQHSADGSRPTPMTAQIGQAIQRGELPPPPGIDPSMIRGASVKIAGPAAALLGAGAGEGLLGMAGPALMRGALMGTGSNLLGGLFGGGGQDASMPPNATQGPTVNPLPLTASKTADIETPSSVPEIGTLSDDPETVDQHEFNDGDHDPNAYNPNIPGEAGGTNKGEDAVLENAFADDSPGIQRMHALAPILMEYYNSGDSGANDPLIRELHNTLEEENPGYLDKVGPEHEEALKQILQQIKEPHLVAAAQIGMPTATNPQLTQMNPAVQPQGHCANCGGTLNPDGSCPQCGANAMQQHPNNGLLQQGIVAPGQQVPFAGQGGFTSNVHTADGIDPNQQGPRTAEQIAAVQQLLQEMGRVREVPMVPLQPWNYSKELAAIQQKPNQAENVDPSTEPQPPQPMDPGTDPNAGMPMPAPPTGVQPMSHVAADSVAERCPNCGSATTGMATSDGDCHCHRCGHDWKMDNVAVDTDGVTSKIAAPEDLGPVDNSQQGPPTGPDTAVADGEDQQQDSSLSWQDTDGNPLQVGQEYEMHNPTYRIPDVVTIDAIKPDGITVTTTADAGPDGGPQLGYTHDISKQEIQTEGVTFVPSQGDPNQTEEPQPAEPMDDSQRVNTQPVQQSVERTTSVNGCPGCGSDDYSTHMSSSTTNWHDCYRCGKAWETREADYEDTNTASREWLNEDPLGDDFDFERFKAMQGAGKQSRNIADIAAKDSRYQEIKERLAANKTAGKRFSPSEQRNFINEEGTARNADLLDLEGTHYKHRDSGTNPFGRSADPYLAPDDHMLFV